MPISDDKFMEMYGAVKETASAVRGIQSDVAEIKIAADETRRDHEDRLRSLEADRDRVKAVAGTAMAGGPLLGGLFGWLAHKLFP